MFLIVLLFIPFVFSSTSCAVSQYYGYPDCDEFIGQPEFSSSGSYIQIPWIVPVSKLPTNDLVAGAYFNCSYLVNNTYTANNGRQLISTSPSNLLGFVPKCTYSVLGEYTNTFRVFFGSGTADSFLGISGNLMIQPFTDIPINRTVDTPTTPNSPSVSLYQVTYCDLNQEILETASSSDGRTLTYDWKVYSDEGLIMRTPQAGTLKLTESDPLDAGKTYQIILDLSTYFGGTARDSIVCLGYGKGQGTTSSSSEDNDSGGSNAGVELIPFFVCLFLCLCGCCWCLVLLTIFSLLFFPIVCICGRGIKEDPDTRISLMEFIGLEPEDLKHQEEMEFERDRLKRSNARKKAMKEDEEKKAEEERLLLGIVSNSENEITDTEDEEKEKKKEEEEEETLEEEEEEVKEDISKMTIVDDGLKNKTEENDEDGEGSTTSEEEEEEEEVESLEDSIRDYIPKTKLKREKSEIKKEVEKKKEEEEEESSDDDDESSDGFDDDDDDEISDRPMRRKDMRRMRSKRKR